jgi:hypothetical protein
VRAAYLAHNDPWGEHDCATLTVAGRRIIFKIDYFDRDLAYHSPDASNPAVTERVLTVMLAEEYWAAAWQADKQRRSQKQQLARALRLAGRGRYPERDRAIVLLSVRAGLRGEITKLTWSMVIDSQGRLSCYIELHDSAAKKDSGPHHPATPATDQGIDAVEAAAWRASGPPVIRSEPGNALLPGSVVNWFRRFYGDLGLALCLFPFQSSHIHHQWSASGVQSRRQFARCAAARRSSLYRASSSLYRGQRPCEAPPDFPPLAGWVRALLIGHLDQNGGNNDPDRTKGAGPRVRMKPQHSAVLNHCRGT